MSVQTAPHRADLHPRAAASADRRRVAPADPLQAAAITTAVRVAAAVAVATAVEAAAVAAEATAAVAVAVAAAPAATAAVAAVAVVVQAATAAAVVAAVEEDNRLKFIETNPKRIIFAEDSPFLIL